jgi:hypothetical protein
MHERKEIKCRGGAANRYGGASRNKNETQQNEREGSWA